MDRRAGVRWPAGPMELRRAQEFKKKIAREWFRFLNLRMPKARKTWAEKMANPNGLPKTIVLSGKSAAKWGEGRMVVPAPLEVDALMQKVKRGKVTTITELRAGLAAQHGTELCCPITTGIFAWMSAHAAVEGEAAGKKKVTPWWRTLKTGRELNPKYPGGLPEQARRLREEGHEVVVKGKRWFVAGKSKQGRKPQSKDLKPR